MVGGAQRSVTEGNSAARNTSNDEALVSNDAMWVQGDCGIASRSAIVFLLSRRDQHLEHQTHTGKQLNQHDDDVKALTLATLHKTCYDSILTYDAACDGAALQPSRTDQVVGKVDRRARVRTHTHSKIGSTEY